MHTWKVGELARETGLTVRTLHHYDAIGLLRPSQRTAAGYRLYGPAEVERLQRIVSLRELGFSLDQIAECIARPEYSLAGVVRRHASRLREQVEAQRRLCDRLEAIADRLDAAEEVSVDELLRSIEEITMFEKYYSEEQLAALRTRREEVGEDRIREVEAEWPELIAKVRAEMERGTDPSSPEVQQLAQRWMALVREFTGGDPGIAASLRRMYDQEPAARDRAGIDPALFEYVNRASVAAEE